MKRRRASHVEPSVVKTMCVRRHVLLLCVERVVDSLNDERITSGHGQEYHERMW